MTQADQISLWACYSSWVNTILTVGIAFFAFKAYFVSNHQRQVENSFRLVELFQTELPTHAEFAKLSGWDAIKHFFSYSIGKDYIPGGAFGRGYPEKITLGDLLCEGPYDNGIISTSCELLDMIGQKVLEGSADPSIIWFYFGQFIPWFYRMLGEKRKLYPYFSAMYKKHERRFLKLPYKRYLTV